jgi:predicted aconitase
VFDLAAVDRALLRQDSFYQVLGYLIGSVAETEVPAIVGLPPVSDDQFQALLSAAASSGGVELLHCVGVTPEASTLDAALQESQPRRVVAVSGDDLRRSRAALSTAGRDEPLGTVCVGAPHLSLRELENLVKLLDGRSVAPSIVFYASTCRFIANAARERGQLEPLEEAGVKVLVDACTYYGSVVDASRGVVMTSSAKWAHYGPNLIGARVVFGTMGQCVESAVAGAIQTTDDAWS